MITKRRSLTDARRWVYCLPNYTTNDSNTTDRVDLTSSDTPPPSFFSSRVELTPETATKQELEFSQQQFNIESTVIQQPPNVDSIKKAQTVYEQGDTGTQEFIQHTTEYEGEREDIERVQSENILQAEPAINSSTTCSTSVETSSQTNTFRSCSSLQNTNRRYKDYIS